jgi:flagellar biosynthesis repressor protein FlbT
VSRKAGRATPASPGSYSKHFLSNESAQHLKSDVARYRTAYLGFVKELRHAQPDSGERLAAINVHVSAGALYKALKEIRKLIKHEAALLAA